MPAAQHRFRLQAAALLLACACHMGAALAQSPFGRVPPPQRKQPPEASLAFSDSEYRSDAARHLYATYPDRVLKGKVPAYVYAVLITETEVDASGKVLNVRVLREPAEADEVTPWVVELIRQASPLPPLLHRRGARYVEIWLVDESGRFQVDTLTEGQR